jgi:UDP-N-acetylglucosamine--N-acetylmuramyl-(pentapeptide) pyrophosphoryl-undecaprenol N-acetylglucosamine transferase
MMQKEFKKKSRSFFNLQDDKFTILIIGGSLGATPINQAIANSIESLLNNNCQLIWQTGSQDYHKYNFLQSHSCSLHKFIDRMDLAYNAADVVISRAGAIAISEICFLSKASILIPSPHVTDDHQTSNANYLKKHSACLMILENQLTKHLLNAIIELKNKSIQESLGNQANKLFKYNSSEEIASIIIKDTKVY